MDRIGVRMSQRRIVTADGSLGGRIVWVELSRDRLVGGWRHRTYIVKPVYKIELFEMNSKNEPLLMFLKKAYFNHKRMYRVYL